MNYVLSARIRMRRQCREILSRNPGIILMQELERGQLIRRQKAEAEKCYLVEAIWR